VSASLKTVKGTIEVDQNMSN